MFLCSECWTCVLNYGKTWNSIVNHGIVINGTKTKRLKDHENMRLTRKSYNEVNFIAMGQNITRKSIWREKKRWEKVKAHVMLLLLLLLLDSNAMNTLRCDLQFFFFRPHWTMFAELARKRSGEKKHTHTQQIETYPAPRCRSCNAKKKKQNHRVSLSFRIVFSDIVFDFESFYKYANTKLRLHKCSCSTVDMAIMQSIPFTYKHTHTQLSRWKIAIFKIVFISQHNVTQWTHCDGTIYAFRFVVVVSFSMEIRMVPIWTKWLRFLSKLILTCQSIGEFNEKFSK